MSMVRTDRKGPVAVVTLDRPERSNSLVCELLEELSAELRAAADDAQAVVLAASGQAFSTGGDVGAIRRADDRSGYARRLVGGLNDTILTMIDLPIPIVAAVHGITTGGSVGLLLASDAVVAEEHVTIRPWYTSFGFSPDGGWTALMPSVIGRARAASWLLEDREVGAATLADWGLVRSVVPGGESMSAALDIAGHLAGRKPGVVARTRKLLARRDQVAADLDAELEAFVAQVVTDEATRGMDAYLAGELR